VLARFPSIAFLFVFAMSLALPLGAQSTNGTINGRVLDPSNKVIVGADLLLINDATGVKYSGRTNDDGIYIVPNLPPGPYRLQVSKRGFKTLIKPDVVLNIQDALSINFTLPIGAAFEIVTVEGGASMINTTDASVSTVIDHTYVENMPLNGRSFQDLILLTPGVVTNTPQVSSVTGFSGEFSVNGQRTESNNYTVDGASSNIGVTYAALTIAGAGASGSVPASTALGTTQALVSVDDLQEFRVQSSTYSAEYGRSPGGQFSFETKSGTNQWHGTAYDYLRNGALDAPDWFNGYFDTPEPPVRQNDFGGTLGGLVRLPGLYDGKDKTFFFISYEGLRLAAPHAANASYVPDAALRASAPKALQQVLNAFPMQSPDGIDDTVNGIAQFIGSWSTPAALNSTSVRFDHSVNDKLRLFFRFSDTNSRSQTLGTAQQYETPATDQISPYVMRTYTAGANSILSSHVSNEFRLNCSSNGVNTALTTDAIGGNTPVNLLQLTGLGPRAFVGFALIYGGYFFELNQSGESSEQKQWNLVDTISFALGHHQFKFGVDYRRLAPAIIRPTPQEYYDYLSKAQVQENSLTTNFQALGSAHPLYTNFSAFAQDEWRVSQRLSLSLGLRWEVNPAPSVTQGPKPYTIDFVSSDPNTWTLAPQGTPLWRTTWFNFAPRLGAVYIIQNTPGREIVVRGGGGVFFDTGQQLGSLSFAGPGFYNQTSVPSASFPTSVVFPPIVNPPVAPYSYVYGFSAHLQLPYTLQWNASIEQALGKSQALTISYVGSHGSRLLQENNVYPSNNPNILVLFGLAENGLTSDYDALQAQLRRRLNRGLTALASYTWSHCIDYGSENYNFSYQRGNCDFDVRHNFSAAFSYDLPSVGHSGFGNAFLNHWGLDDRFTARSAFPITLVGNELLQPNGQVYDGGLSFVPSQRVYLYGVNCATVLQGLGDLSSGQPCPGGRAINPSAFRAVNSGVGDVPRNFARLFGAWQMDLAVRRDFPIHERLKLQFRAESFNIFNHPNFGTVNQYFGQTTFGQATATLASSLGVLSPLYQMGGPRSMQFALKLMF
jgi:carboxypeptidase family protein